MTRGTAQVLTGGPALVERAFGAKLDKEELGGASVHLESGVVDNGGRRGRRLAQIRRFLSYLPANVWELAPRATPTDEPKRRDEASCASSRATAARQCSAHARGHVVDRGSLFDSRRTTGALVTGLAASRG